MKAILSAARVALIAAALPACVLADDLVDESEAEAFEDLEELEAAACASWVPPYDGYPVNLPPVGQSIGTAAGPAYSKSGYPTYGWALQVNNTWGQSVRVRAIPLENTTDGLSCKEHWISLSVYGVKPFGCWEHLGGVSVQGKIVKILGSDVCVAAAQLSSEQFGTDHSALRVVAHPTIGSHGVDITVTHD